ncbi:hypothetical protein TRICI_002816 [Trichomonascus ciferrii]|uniref:Inositol polyphosphate-related phosphatase domain-containing protein n=1 Tax=Trichomonascus ciferrii TaxID=44093 RepID=A0A642V5Q0_9ASCO|nr:hypothetical protein TRICI_002816 [Trichomonascus ciferrii]
MDVFLATFNCAKVLQRQDGVSSWVSEAVGESAPRLLAFGFEEVCPIVNGCFGDTKSYTEPLLEGIKDAIGSGYNLVDSVILGAVILAVFADDTATVAAHSTATGVRRGYVGSGLKGGVGLRLKLESGEEFTFAAAHLAANEGMRLSRNSDFYEIATGLDFGDGYGLYKPNTHTFFLGDLNYRSTANPLESTESNTSSSQSLLADETIDELTLEVKESRVLYGFNEAPIEFKPTYKFIKGSVNEYNMKRLPSWCDRIFYLDYDTPPKVHAYNSLPNVSTSDHKPVYLSITLPKEPPRRTLNDDGYYLYNKDIYLGLRANTVSFPGQLSDQAIGWAIYLLTTRWGNAYLSLLALSFIGIFQIF